jgi:transposase
LKVENIQVDETIERVRKQIEEEKDLSPVLRASLDLLLTLVTLLINRLGLNSRNSSKSPASDPNRKKENKKGSGNKPGGQKGHAGNHLEMIDDPDHIEDLKMDRTALPADGQFQCVGYERRQIFDNKYPRSKLSRYARLSLCESGVLN